MLAVGFAGPPVAAAHPGHAVVRAERYLKLDVSAHEARVVVSINFGPDEAMRRLSAADRDHDGRVTDAEARAALAAFQRRLGREVPVTLDGRRVTPHWADGYLGPVGPVAPAPVTLEMVGHVPLEGGAHRLSIRDGMSPASYDRTDVAFEARDGAKLLASGLGPEPGNVTQALAYGHTAPAGGVLTANVEVPGTPPERRTVWLAVVGVLAALALSAWALLLARRKGKVRS